eukprot:2386800-Pyramimonas_sp.AAC.1
MFFSVCLGPKDPRWPGELPGWLKGLRLERGAIGWTVTTYQRGRGDLSSTLKGPPGCQDPPCASLLVPFACRLLRCSQGPSGSCWQMAPPS